MLTWTLVGLGLATLILYKLFFAERVATARSNIKEPVWLFWNSMEVAATCTLRGDQYWLDLQITRAYMNDLVYGLITRTEQVCFTLSPGTTRVPERFDSYNRRGQLWWYILKMRGLENGKGVEIRLRNTRSHLKPAFEG